MKNLLLAASLLSTLAFSGSAFANNILQTWELTNKSPGALGADYGLRLNQMNSLGLENGSSTHMIFDFERTAHSVTLQLVDVGGGALELRLDGTAYGALFDDNEADGYGADFAGTYDLAFTWQNVEQNAGGFDLIAERGIDTHSLGSGSGTVLGVGLDTAFRGTDVLSIFDWSGSYNHTLDVLDSNTPDGSGWLSYGTGRHNGDFGFNMRIAVSEPATLALLGLGLIGIGLGRRGRA